MTTVLIIAYFFFLNTPKIYVTAFFPNGNMSSNIGDLALNFDSEILERPFGGYMICIA